jgi:hypothetical protein
MLRLPEIDLGIFEIITGEAWQERGGREGAAGGQFGLDPSFYLEEIGVLAAVLQHGGDIDEVQGRELIKLKKVVVKVVGALDQVVENAAVRRHLQLESVLLGIGEAMAWA